MVKVLLDNINKIFDEDKPEKRVVAVKDLTMEIPDKKVISLVGPSGCGKTTTMRIISGLETPTTGRVFFGDQDVTNLHTRDRDVAMIFQFPVVYHVMSVFDNIAFPLRARKLPKTEINRKVKEVAELLKLTTVLDKKPKGLDVGGRQRVALARAIVRTPKLFLFDEPLSSIDPASRVELRGELKKIQRELGQTTVFVTHDQAEALTMGDKIAVMHRGELLQYDTGENLYDNPVSTFVGWFIGNPGMNFIDCSYKEVNGNAFLETSHFTLPIHQKIGGTIRKHATDTELILGIRPENVEVSASGKGKVDWNASKCILAEPIGNRMVLHLKLDGELVKAKTDITFRLPRGNVVWFRFPMDYIKIYDKKTEKLII